MRNLLHLFGAKNAHHLLRLPILVVSERLKESAKDLGFHQVIVAKNASHETILKTLIKEKENV
jgi:uroporphyrinogen-III synthase